MWLTLFFCIPAALGQAIFSLGLTTGDASASSGYQPLLPQTTYIQPYASGVVPVASYPSYPVGMGYPSTYGVGYPTMGYGYPPYTGGAYPQIYEIHRPEGPMKRFWKGAADGVVQGSLGWLG